jgi:hypothetical protein
VYVWTGQAVNVAASGSWNVGLPNERLWTGPNGYPPEIDSQIWIPACKVRTDEPYGKLLARVGGGWPFAVGGYSEFRVVNNGWLEFQINDKVQCQGDNGGSVQVAVDVR